MPYLALRDFKAGMNRTRERVAGVPGTLWTLKNAHITRGGDIERAKKFVSTYTLPAGTYGLAQVRGQLYAFGSADLAASMPVGVLYQRLQSPIGGETMVEVLDAKGAAGKLYVVAEFSNGNIYHFYDGTRLTDWDNLSDSNSTAETLAQALADKVSSSSAVSAVASGSVVTMTARVPGTAFTVSKATTNGGSNADQDISLSTPQANVVAVAEVRATVTVQITGGTEEAGVNRISALTVDGNDILESPVDWTSSHSVTAIRLAASINNATATTGFSAQVSGATVTIRAPIGAGATVNGDAVSVVAEGDVTVTAGSTLSGGVTAVAAVAQVTRATITGTYEPLDTFTLTVNGTAYKATGRGTGAGVSAFTFKKRVWSPANTLWRYCALNNPAVWYEVSTPTSGFINMSSETEGSERLLVAASYGAYAAVFARKTIRLWAIATDPAENEFLQPLENTGTFAPRSVLAYGFNDVFYLDDPGIRSLRARQTSGDVYVDDVGTPVDDFVIDEVAALAPVQQAAAHATLDPVTNRFWLVLGGKILVYSAYATSRISAWSYYEPGFNITHFARVGNRLYARAGDTVYLYGGASGQEYPGDDEMPVTVETPYMGANSEAAVKELTGFDISCVNDWEAEILVDANDPTKTVSAGILNGTTYSQPAIEIPNNAAIFALKLTCRRAGPATLSGIVVHYNAAPGEQR